jgi:hypothetical protein
MSSWLRRLLLQCDYADDVLVAPQQLTEEPWQWAAIREANLFSEHESARQTWCPECGDELSDVVTLPTGGAEGLYLNCGACGLVPIEIECLRRWRFRIDRLAELLRERLHLTGECQERFPNRLWALGRKREGPTSRDYFLGRGLFRRDAGSWITDMRFPRASVLLYPTQPPSRAVLDHCGGQAVSLLDLMAWNDGALICDLSCVGNVAVEPPSIKPTRPRKRASRAAAIEAIQKQLAEHLRAARSHAEASLELGKEATLLPRPSRKDLAKLTGLKEVNVSRCFQDPAAKELRVLWELAADLDGVLRLPSSRLR